MKKRHSHSWDLYKDPTFKKEKELNALRQQLVKAEQAYEDTLNSIREWREKKSSFDLHNMVNTINQALSILTHSKFQEYDFSDSGIIRSEQMKLHHNYKSWDWIEGVYEVFSKKGNWQETSRVHYGYVVTEPHLIIKAFSSTAIRKIWLKAVEDHECILGYKEFVEFMGNPDNSEIVIDILRSCGYSYTTFSNEEFDIPELHMFFKMLERESFSGRTKMLKLHD